ncbi:MAG: hypothetical protein KGL39_03885 [Patescibacteria group bacterium]|nr:hypothetical protein [Patescibacteria group bacterium]
MSAEHTPTTFTLCEDQFGAWDDTENDWCTDYGWALLDQHGNVMAYIPGLDSEGNDVDRRRPIAELLRSAPDLLQERDALREQVKELRAVLQVFADDHCQCEGPTEFHHGILCPGHAALAKSESR